MNKEGISHIPQIEQKIRTHTDASNHTSTNQQIKPQIDTIADCTELGRNPSAHMDLLALLHAHTGLHPTGHQGTEQRQHLKGTRRPTFLDVTGEALTTSRPFHLHRQARRRATPQPHGPCANGEQRGWLLGGPPASATEAFASVCNQSRMGTEEQEKGMEEEESQR